MRFAFTQRFKGRWLFCAIVAWLACVAGSACEGGSVSRPVHATRLTLQLDLDAAVRQRIRQDAQQVVVRHAVARRAIVKETIRALHARLQLLDIHQPSIAPCGPGRICLTAAGAIEPGHLIEAVSRQGRIELHLLDDHNAGCVDQLMLPPGTTLQRSIDRFTGTSGQTEAPYLSGSEEAAILNLPADRLPPKSVLLVGEVRDPRTRQHSGYRSWLVERRARFTLDRFTNIRPYRHRLQGYYVHAELTAEDRKRVQQLARAHAGRRVAVVLDGRVNGVVVLDPQRCLGLAVLDVCLGAANLFPPVPPGREPTFQDARVLAALLKSGQLPARVAIVDVATQ